MKVKKLKYLLFIFISCMAFSQDENEVILKMCNDFNKTSALSDSMRVESMYTKFLHPYLEKQKPAKIDSIGNSMYLRLQRECPEFRRFLYDLNKTKTWQTLSEIPQSQFTKKQKKEFEKISEFYYYEAYGDEKTVVTIKNGYWIDHFPDGTYSKNFFNWNSDYQFVLEHIESNNFARKGFSRKGDKYFYSIIRKVDNYYEITAQIPNQAEILMFKLYIK